MRELNQRTAPVLARVEGGEHLEITRNGKPIATLAPVESTPVRALLEAGELRLARGPLPLLLADEEAPDTRGVDAVVADRRSELRW